MTKRGADALDVPAKKSHADDDAESLIVYSPCIVPPELKSRMNSLVDVLLPPRYLVADHKQVKLRQLWGTDSYTDDSDLVAVLVHTGHVKLKASAPKMPLLVSLRVCPATATYAGSDRNGLISRDWAGAHAGVSYKVERCLQHTSGAVPPPEVSLLRPNPTTRQIPGSLVQIAPGPGQTFAIPPAACLVVFSLSSEPWLKYSLAARGLALPHRASRCGLCTALLEHRRRERRACVECSRRASRARLLAAAAASTATRESHAISRRRPRG